MHTEFTVMTQGSGLYEFTDEVRRWIRGLSAERGLLTLFCRHTSCSLAVQENADLDVRADLEQFFTRLVPPADEPSQSWIRHRAEGPDDMPAHIKAALLPVSLSIPVRDGAPTLGVWQGLYVFEHRTHGHRRKIAGHFLES